MELQNFNVKIFLQTDAGVDFGQFNPTFQSWIQNKQTPELLIDVADYLHVPEGPGMVLVGLEADYSMDNTSGRWGLRYNRKAPQSGSAEQQLASAFGSALQACQRLEADPRWQGRLRFCLKEMECCLNDRALAPNTPETLAKARPLFESFFEKLLGAGSFSLDFESDPRERFGVTIKSQNNFGLNDLLSRLDSF